MDARRVLVGCEFVYVATVDTGSDVDAPRCALVMDHVRRGDDPDVGHVAQRHPSAARSVEWEVEQAAHAVASRRRAPDVDVVGASAAEDLLEVFVRRHEAASTLITTNRPTQDWGVFLGDVPAATAILDRFLAHAEIVQMPGKSYRLRSRAGAAADA